MLATKKLWRDDAELFSLINRELYTAVVGDIMDQLGYCRQFLPPQMRPLRSDMRVAGRAMTVVEQDLDADGSLGAGHPLNGRHFGVMLEALDDLRPHEVYVCAGASPTYALWGELMSTRAAKLGAVGAVVDGYSRDTLGILQLRFPTFSHGCYAQDQAPRGKVVDFRVPLTFGQVQVAPGDVVVGDLDGVCVVPRALEEEVFRRALEKARGEKTVQQAIMGGMSAREAFDTYGIL